MTTFVGNIIHKGEMTQFVLSRVSFIIRILHLILVSKGLIGILGDEGEMEKKLRDQNSLLSAFRWSVKLILKVNDIT